MNPNLLHFIFHMFLGCLDILLVLPVDRFPQLFHVVQVSLLHLSLSNHQLLRLLLLKKFQKKINRILLSVWKISINGGTFKYKSNEL